LVSVSSIATNLVIIAICCFAVYSALSPKVVMNETRSLSSLDYTYLTMTSAGASEVSVSVKASPRSVDVFLLDEANWKKFETAFAARRSGEFDYHLSLSSLDVLTNEQSVTLPPGTWRVVVQRPSGSEAPADWTIVSVVVTRQAKLLATLASWFR
jgi:hypothetical protein